MAVTRGTLQHRRVRLSGSAAVWVVGTFVGLVVAQRIFVAAHRPLSWAAASALAAMLLDPVVERLAVHIRRVPAVLLALVAIAAVGVGTTYFVFDDVERALDRLQEVAPEAAASVEDRNDRLGEIARDGRLGARVDSFVEVLERRATGGDDVLRTTAGTAPVYLVCAILTVFLLTYGPRIAKAAVEQDPDEDRRRRVSAITSLALRRARRAVLLTAAVATIMGLSATAVADWLDLPAPAALGFAIAVLALLPHVGLIVGSIPLLLLTVGFRSGTMAIALAVVVLVVQVLDSVLMRPWIARRTVHIGLLVPWVVALLGYAVYGIGGAAYSTIAVVFALAVIDQVQMANAVRPAAGE